MTATGLVSRLRAGARVLVLAGVAGSAWPAPAIPAAAAPASTPVPVLTALSATHHRGYDQLVFTFTGAAARTRAPLVTCPGCPAARAR